MDEYRKIALCSRVMQQICLVLLVLLPFYLAHHWLLPLDRWIDGMPFDQGRLPTGQWPPALHKQVGGILTSFVPGAFVALSLWHLRALFKRYAQGEIFTAETVSLYNRIAAATLWFVITLILAQSALSVLMSYDSEAPFVSVTFTHAHLFALFGASVLRLIAWIMALAQRVQAENRSFV